MSFSKAETMSAPLVEVSAQLWSEIIKHLRIRGAGIRESGAFLLGGKTERGCVITRYLPYEQLQADALKGDYVSLTAVSFAKLWDLCRVEKLSVVADVHTHRLSAGQSRSDRANPMIALVGHIAFIVPRFAKERVQLQDLGMYVYLGNHKWMAYSGVDIRCLLCLTQNGGSQ